MEAADSVADSVVCIMSMFVSCMLPEHYNTKNGDLLLENSCLVVFLCLQK